MKNSILYKINIMPPILMGFIICAVVITGFLTWLDCKGVPICPLWKK